MIKNQLFEILNFGHCDLPFDLAQGGGELVEPFGICFLLFEIFSFLKPYILRSLQPVARKKP